MESHVATTGVVPAVTPPRTIVNVTGLPVCGSPIDSAWLNSYCAHRFVGPDEEAVCVDEAACTGAMRLRQKSAAQHTPANPICPRWCRDREKEWFLLIITPSIFL